MRILVDMDGVVADFARGACHAHGRQWPYQRKELLGDHGWDIPGVWGMSTESFWAPLANVEFWASLSKTAEADALMREVICAAGLDNVCFCSQPQAIAGCAEGKQRWVQEHFPHIPLILACKGRRQQAPKEWLAHAGVLLIDDHSGNVARFREHGGLAFLFPRPWNRHWSLETFWIDQLRSYLQAVVPQEECA